MKIESSKIETNAPYVYSLDSRVLKILLKDKTSKKNLIWATEEYAHLGSGYSAFDEISLFDIKGNTSIITPRILKSKESQTIRIREMAEVFTPAWVCNKQNNLIDSAWFGRENVFNIENEDGWQTIDKRIDFPDEKGKSWQDYVKANRLEISCGEAPYLTSRYDAVTGKIIPVKDRIGILDRKLRIVSENVDCTQEWYFWGKKAIQSVYGYDWQGDNVFLARENLLFSFIENYELKFGVSPILKDLISIARILAWNIFQMDGIKFVIPNSCKKETYITENLFGVETEEANCFGCQIKDNEKHNGIYCRTYDWTANRSVDFYSTFIKEKKRNGTI